MAVPTWVIDILACPADQSALDAYPDERDLRELRCPQCGRHYPVTDDIPVLLIDQATQPADRA